MRLVQNFAARVRATYQRMDPALRQAGAHPASFDLGASVALARVLLGRSLHRAVAGPLAANPATGAYQLLYDDPRATSLGKRIRRQWTRNGFAEIRWAARPGESFWIPRRDGYVIDGVRASVRTGLAWDREERRLFLESYGSLAQAMTWGRSLGETSRRSAGKLTGVNFILPSTGFFHFLIEVLPAFLQARHEVGERLRVVLQRNAPSYLLRWLRHVAADTEIVSLSGVFDFESLVIPGYVGSGTYSPEDATWLRDVRGEANSIRGRPGLYLSRVGQRRSPANEIQIEDRMKAEGFHVIRHFGSLEPSVQVGMARSASTIAGVHGAALAISAFATPGTRLLEVASSDRPVDVFHRLASGALLEYTCVAEEAILSGESIYERNEGS